MFGDKLKKLISKNEEGNNKKTIENLIVFVVILIITIIMINSIWNGNKETNKQESVNNSSKQLASDKINTTNTELDLEIKLENILAKIQGVGEVKVCISYSESEEIIAMYNENSKVSTTEETDTSGGIRKLQETDLQKEIIYQEENGEKLPITQKIVQAKIEGAIIIAKGAANVNTKTNIIQAVEAVTGLATHKIQVFEMN